MQFNDNDAIVNHVGINLEEAEDRLRNEVEGIHAVRIKGVKRFFFQKSNGFKYS